MKKYLLAVVVAVMAILSVLGTIFVGARLNCIALLALVAISGCQVGASFNSAAEWPKGLQAERKDRNYLLPGESSNGSVGQSGTRTVTETYEFGTMSSEKKGGH